MKRITAPGLSYFDARRRSLVTIEDDVLGIKRQVEERWSELEVWFDQDRLKWVIIQTHRNGDEKSILFEVDRLDGRVISRIERADQDSAGQDFLEDIDRHNEEIEKAQDRRFSDQIGDFGERLIHALRKDGIYDHMNIYGVRNRG